MHETVETTNNSVTHQTWLQA